MPSSPTAQPALSSAKSIASSMLLNAFVCWDQVTPASPVRNMIPLSPTAQAVEEDMAFPPNNELPNTAV